MQGVRMRLRGLVLMLNDLTPNPFPLGDYVRLDTHS